MTRHRKITFSAGVLAAFAVAMPVAAHASPLLSGYGGPGQGSQRILGSALLGGGGGPGASGSAPAAASGAAPSLAAPSLRPGSTSGAPVAHAKGGAVAPQRTSRGTVGATLAAYPVSARTARAPSSPALGISEQDLLYIVLALATVVMAGALTRRLTQPPRRLGTGG